MKILVENIEETKSRVQEDGRGKNYLIEGIFIQSNIKNRNGRIYPKEVVQREVDRYIREMITTNRAVGELNHPKDEPGINYERVSHKFESLKEEGDNWTGRARITKNTPMGKIVCGLMDEGVQMGISTRAVGSTKTHNGVKVVQNDFFLITAGDIVSDPSAPDAFLTNLMENKEWVWENGMLVEKSLEDVRDEVNRAAKTKTLNEEKLVEIFHKLLTGNSKV